MNNLIKPQKQSYTGDEGQVLAYADTCEVAWLMNICSGSIGAAALLGLAVPPALIALGVSCFAYYVLFSAACKGYI